MKTWICTVKVTDRGHETQNSFLVDAGDEKKAKKKARAMMNRITQRYPYIHYDKDIQVRELRLAVPNLYADSQINEPKKASELTNEE